MHTRMMLGTPVRGRGVVVLACLACACTGGRREGADSAGRETGADSGAASAGLPELDALGSLNVIMVHVDTLRADRLSFYGSLHDTMPGLSRIPHVSVRGYHATAPWTLPSTASALLSLTPERHGRVSIAISDVELSYQSMAERLQEAGYATGLFSGNQILAGDDGLAQGFDVREEVPDLADLDAQTMATLAASGEAWIDSLPEGQPFFAWFQPMDTHAPYRPLEPWLGTWADYEQLPFSIDQDSFTQAADFVEAWEAAASTEERTAMVENVRAVYDELILQQDAAISELVEWLSATDRLDDTLIVLSSDHGETIADDQRPTISHMESVRPELIQLPLVFLSPRLQEREVVCLSSNVDLGPTLLRGLGLSPLEEADGIELQDGCRELVFSSLYAAESEERDLLWLGVSDQDYKLEWNCEDGTFALYDLREDPGALVPLDLTTVEGSDWYLQALFAYRDAAVDLHPGLSCEARS